MNLSASAFADTGHSLQTVGSDGGAAQTRSLLVFHLGERAYGLAVEHVVQIIAMVKLTPVPQSEQVLEGVANIHGKIVPVLSARRHLGLPVVQPQLYTPIILLQTGERTIGLIVDEVADVFRLPANQMTGPEAILPLESEDSAVLEGVVYQGDTVIMVINPRCLLNPSQMRAYRRIAQFVPEPEPENTIEPALPARSSKGPNGGSLQEEIPAPVVGDPAPLRKDAKKQPAGNGHRKSRKGRRNFDETLAGEIAGLAADLPPSEGQMPAADELDQDPDNGVTG